MFPQVLKGETYVCFSLDKGNKATKTKIDYLVCKNKRKKRKY